MKVEKENKNEIKLCDYLYSIFIVDNVLISILKVINIDSILLMAISYIIVMTLLYFSLLHRIKLRNLYLIPISFFGMILSIEYLPLALTALVLCLSQRNKMRFKVLHSFCFALVISIILSACANPVGNILYEKQRYYSPDRTSYFLRGYPDACDGGQFIKIYKNILPFTKKTIAIVHISAMTNIHSNWSGNEAIRANRKIIEMNNLKKAEVPDGVSVITNNEFMYRLSDYIKTVLGISRSDEWDS